MTKHFLIALLFSLIRATTFSQNPLFIGQTAENVRGLVKEQVEGYYRSEGYHQAEMNWDTKYSNGKISTVIVCEKNVPAIDFPRLRTFA